MSFKTKQEEFWAGDFGNEYIERNTLEDLVPARISLFSEILSNTNNVNSFIEFGANIGANLTALKQLSPNAEFTALELNSKAVDVLESYGWIDKIIHGSFLDGQGSDLADMSFTSGVLIHLNPDMLDKAYENLYKTSRKYIMVCEYYNPSPVTINYRGNEEYLFKRDFAGEMLDKYPDLKLVDYGFKYKRDPNYFYDDLTWFLMEKV